MSSSPLRCEYCRLHRDPTTACECQQRRQHQVSPTPALKASHPIPVQSPMIKRGRGRPRKNPSPASDAESDQDVHPSTAPGVEIPEPPSPLARITSSVRTYWLRSSSQKATPPQSPVSSSHSASSSEEEQLIFDLELDEEDNITVAPIHARTPEPNLMASPASTQVVEETPLNRSFLGDTPDRVHFAVHPNPAIEIQRLRDSRTQLAQNLERSTEHVNRLHARLLIYTGDKTALAAELGQLREGAVGDVVERTKGGGGIASGVRGYGMSFVVMLVGLPLLWGWINGPDFAYIRRRRAEVLCE